MSEAGVTENATHAAAAASEPGPGAALQEERRRQSLSLTDVARQLKLAPRQVEALERDDFAALPGPVFVRGFLRNYARLLGLDPEPMVRTVDRLMAPGMAAEGEPRAVASLERGAAAPVVESARGESRGRWPLPLVCSAVILVTGYLATRDRTPQPSSVDVPVGVAPTEVPAQSPAPDMPLPTATPPAPVTQQQPTTELHPAPAAAPATVAPTLPPAPAAVPPPAPAPQAATGPAAPVVRTVGSTGPAIRMTFSRESWVEVRDRDGNVIFGQLNPEGSIRVVRGHPPFSLVVGNASGVSLTYNGKTVDLAPHTRTDVARLTLE
jgi:cytoskeleton protein RodZ